MPPDKPINVKQAVSDKKYQRHDLVFDAGRGTWFIRDNKIYAKHKLGEVLRVKPEEEKANVQ
jgi:hypothetical protein